jgi:hypothetical protein
LAVWCIQIDALPIQKIGDEKMARRLPETMRVAVTDDDLAIAHRRDKGGCAYAAAIMRLFPQAQNVEVTMASIRFNDPVAREQYRVSTPTAPASFVDSWDSDTEYTPENVPVLIIRKTSGQVHPIKPITPAARLRQRERAREREAERRGEDKAQYESRNRRNAKRNIEIRRGFVA